MTLLSGFIPGLFLLASLQGKQDGRPPVSGSEISFNSIYLFSEKADGVLVQREQALLDADIPGMAERDMLVTVITKQSDPALYEQSVEKGSDFTLVMYGKTGEKLYQSHQLVNRIVLYKVLAKTTTHGDKMDFGKRD